MAEYADRNDRTTALLFLHHKKILIQWCVCVCVAHLSLFAGCGRNMPTLLPCDSKILPWKQMCVKTSLHIGGREGGREGAHTHDMHMRACYNIYSIL